MIILQNSLSKIGKIIEFDYFVVSRLISFLSKLNIRVMKATINSVSKKKKNQLSGMITDTYCHLFNSAGNGGGKYKWYVVSSIRLDD